MGILIVLLAVMTWFSVWYIIRSINAMDDIRFIADVHRVKNPNVPYQKSPTVLIGILLVAVPVFLIVLILAGAVSAASVFATLPNTF